MLFTPRYSDVTSRIESSRGTVRVSDLPGTLISLGTSPTEGSWTTVIASTAYDSYGLLLNLNFGFTDSSSVTSIVDIGVGAAGNEAEIVTDIWSTSAGSYLVTEGQWFYFPVFVKAGSRVSMRGKSITPWTPIMAFIQLKQLAQKPTFTCSKVDYFGSTTFTSGTITKGSWSLVGTTSAAFNYKTIAVSVGVTNSTLNALGYHCDIAVGNGTNFSIVLQDLLVITTTSEHVTFTGVMDLVSIPVKANTSVYVRAQCNGTPQNMTAAIMGCY